MEGLGGLGFRGGGGGDGGRGGGESARRRSIEWESVKELLGAKDEDTGFGEEAKSSVC